MSMLSKVVGGKSIKPRRTMIYGTSGIGKSLWASQAEGALVIDIEDGCGDIDVPKVRADNLVEVYSILQELVMEGHNTDYQTVVIDSADWLERLIWDSLCEREGHSDISEFGYGQGYSKACGVLDDFLKLFEVLRQAEFGVIVVAHSEIKKFTNPTGESYDRYVPKMHSSFSSRLIEWADEVLFANYKVFTKEIKEGFNQKRNVGIDGGGRVLHTTEAPGWVAKNRLNLPPEMPLAYSEYQKYLPTKKEVKNVKSTKE